MDFGDVPGVVVPGLADPVFVDVEDEDVPDEYVERVVAAAGSMSSETVALLCEATVRYCEWGRGRWSEGGDPGEGFPVPEGVVGEAILDYVSAGSLGIDVPEGDGVPVRFTLNCAWDPEHGLEWLLRDGVILYVGPFVQRYEWDDLVAYQSDEHNFAYGQA